MQIEKKKFLKRLLFGNLIVFLILAGLVLIVTFQCTNGDDCYNRGVLIGEGAGRLFTFGNLVAFGIYYWQTRQKR